MCTSLMSSIHLVVHTFCTKSAKCITSRKRARASKMHQKCKMHHLSQTSTSEQNAPKVQNARVFFVFIAKNAVISTQAFWHKHCFAFHQTNCSDRRRTGRESPRGETKASKDYDARTQTPELPTARFPPRYRSTAGFSGRNKGTASMSRKPRMFVPGAILPG